MNQGYIPPDPNCEKCHGTGYRLKHGENKKCKCIRKKEKEMDKNMKKQEKEIAKQMKKQEKMMKKEQRKRKGSGSSSGSD